MPLPPKLNKFSTLPPVIATFDYEDIIDASGVLELFLTTLDVSVVLGTKDPEYSLTSKNSRSDEDLILHRGTSGDTDFDFDSKPFNTLRRASGTADFYLLIRTTGADNDTALTGDVTAGLYHYDGSTETQIGSNVVRRLLSGIQTTTYDVFSGKIDVAETTFRPGDIVRLKINLKTSGVDEGGTSNLCGCYCDPAAFTTVATGTTNSSLRVPFLIDQ